MLFLAIAATVITSLSSQCVERPDNGTMCGNTICTNGECITDTFPTPNGVLEFETCECDHNWKGLGCNMCCPLECVHGYCYRQTIQEEPFCVCNAGWMGDFCNVTEIFTPGPPIVVPDCSLIHRNQTEQCFDQTCHNGHCNITYHETEFGTIPYGQCDCDEGWKGRQCEECCDLPCVNGTCDFYNGDVNDKFCNCYTGFTNKIADNCTEIITTPDTPTITVTVEVPTPTWYWYVLGGGLLLIFIVITLLFCLLGVLYKKYYFLMKIIYRFQQFEDDDGREYDVFISYRSSSDDDRHFVMHKMFPKLEQQFGFSLCIDQRDFIPGAAIAENIPEAITNSRRTILLLSPEYCRSEWTQFEFQAAQTEALSQKHRIIPIIYRDISQVNDMDKSLDLITRTTYLEWPGDNATEKAYNRFWDHLKLAMPKLKTDQPAVQA